jgi:hypothetical protein
MSLTNTTISVNLKDTAGNVVANASVKITVAGNIYNLVSDINGSCIISFALSSITLGTIQIDSVTHLSYNKSYTISSGSNSLAILLSIDSNQINKTIQILDTNNFVAPNVLVSLNGSIVGRTDVSGHIAVLASAGNCILQTNSPNYIPFILSGNYTSSSFPDRLIIKPVVITGKIITLTTSSFANILVSGESLTDNINTDSSGNANTNINLIPGSYTFTISKNDYITKTINLTILDQITNYSLGTLTPINLPQATGTQNSTISSLGSNKTTLTAGADTGSFGIDYRVNDISPTQAPTSTSTISAAPSTAFVNTGANTELEYPAEWVYPNSVDGKYLTGTQARIYIGNLFIDEIDTLYYVYNNNRIPVYGYSSPDVDAFGNGRRLVQGQLSINFVSEGYLFTVLSEYHKKNVDANKSPAEKQTDNVTSQLVTLHTQQAKLIAQQNNGDKTSATATALTSISNQITSLLAVSGSGTLTKVKQAIANADTATSSKNAIRKDVPFDVIINASGGGRTTTRKLKNCLLTSNEQVWDQSDNVVKDVYGFIGVEMI